MILVIICFKIQIYGETELQTVNRLNRFKVTV